MPNGKTHDRISIYTTPIVAILIYIITKDIKTTTILMFAYVFASFVFNGDLDCHSKPFNRWWIFKMIWIPYQIIFNHRSIFTHGLIIGTVFRLIYLAIIPIIILLITNDITIILIWVESNINVLIPVIIGLELGSAVHTISDYLS